MMDSPQAPFPVTRGLYYGDGLFETVRFDARCGGYVDLDGHRKRLRSGAKRLGLHIPENVFSGFVPTEEKAAVRWTFWRRGGPPYFSDENAADALVESRPIVGEREPVGLRVSSHRVAPSAFSRFKTLNGLPYVMAARETHPEVALLLSRRRFGGVPLVACAAGYNVFFVKDGRKLYTPPLATGCIAGTMREFILTHAREADMDANVTPIKYDEIFEFDGAVLTNAVALFRPVASINGRERIPDDGILARLERLLVSCGRLSPEALVWGNR
jgi:branched-chain amino acid aminotransferase